MFLRIMYLCKFSDVIYSLPQAAHEELIAFEPDILGLYLLASHSLLTTCNMYTLAF